MGWTTSSYVRSAIALCLPVVVAATSIAQEVVSQAEPTNSSPPAVAAPPSSSVTIPALSPVEIAIDVALGSKLSKTGEVFPFHLAKPVMLDGAEAIPAGTPGQGEVIHAKKGGGGGAPGELVLAAKYLQVGNRQLRLRSLKLEAIGLDNVGTVTTLNAVAAGTIPVASVIGFFISGGEKNLAMGTVLPAKTAEPFVIELSAPAGKAEQQNVSESTAGNDATSKGRGN